MTRDEFDVILSRIIPSGEEGDRIKQHILEAADEYAAHMVERHARGPEVPVRRRRERGEAS